ncbi:DUF397 domain-containing protein [Micromonospora sp. NPDC050397]|uniref:DUF397 domain-containing protein n=1 Tax=Micromonospora sp. NPDC050397 TaxID=3364279 RepID=UPI003850A6A1
MTGTKPSGAAWRKSSRSGSNANCVEVAGPAGTALVRVRDSKNPDGPALAFAAPAWSAFVAGLGPLGPR